MAGIVEFQLSTVTLLSLWRAGAPIMKSNGKSKIRSAFLNMQILPHVTLTACLSAAVLFVSGAGTSTGDKSFTPLKVDLATLASTDGLMLSNVEEEVVPFTFEDGTTRDIRKQTFRFFSQRFLDEDWYHDAFLFEPVDLKASDRDKAILLSHVYNNKMFDEMLNKYGLRSAAVVGVPVLLFKPNPVNNAFFKNHPDIRRSESEWQEFTFQRFRETGNINVTSFAVIMKAKWRALAAMEKVLDRKLTRVIYCGGSKAGAAVRAMFKEDPRIVSVVRTTLQCVVAKRPAPVEGESLEGLSDIFICPLFTNAGPDASAD